MFTVRFFKSIFQHQQETASFLHQCFEVGFRSVGLVGLTGFILGLVLTMQLRPTMIEYGVESQIPAIVGIAIIREIGPVITALIFAGKVGSGIGAELGSMRVTEQIDAMEVSGANPFRYLVATRVLACTLMLPLLVLVSDAISLYGSWVGVNLTGKTSFQLFWTQVFDALSINDIIPALIKTFFFGGAIGLIGCFYGYHSQRGTEGVGRSANASVVVASILIFFIDLIAVQITEILGYN
jgi:phospholipid/cholesterol/gamma-HCH transport system permease protein